MQLNETVRRLENEGQRFSSVGINSVRACRRSDNIEIIIADIVIRRKRMKYFELSLNVVEFIFYLTVIVYIVRGWKK